MNFEIITFSFSKELLKQINVNYWVRVIKVHFFICRYVLIIYGNTLGPKVYGQFGLFLHFYTYAITTIKI